MNSKEYWQKRGELTKAHLMQKADDFADDMEKAYKAASESIEKDISVFFQRFAKNEGITLAEANKLLKAGELEQFKMTVEEYIQKGIENSVSEKWLKELESASDLYRISRLKALNIQIQQQIELIAAYKEQGLSKTLQEIFEEGYYRNIFDFQQFTGVGSAFATLDTKAINAALSKPWTYDGETFSTRIWKDRDKLKYSLEKILTQGIIRGDSPDKTAKLISKETGTELSASRRLVLTESAAVAERASLESYKELGIDEIEILVTLDEKTCGTCGPLDGRHFPKSEAKTGVNIPPFHPWCRCTTVPYFDDEFTADEQRAARDKNGNTYYVPGNMTYEEWKRKYVDSRDNADMGRVIGGVKNILSGNSNKILNEFRDSLPHLKDEKLREIFTRLADETPIKTSFKNNSYHKNGVIYLNSRATPSTLAHELFHKLDKDYGISESRLLSNSIKNDYQRLKNIAEGYGGSIEDVLYSKYKEAFEYSVSGNLKLKEEYRGVSDILNGMSGGKIKLGYRHSAQYWEHTLALEKETWAQFGRTLYNENENAIDMLKFICPETYATITEKVKELS